MNNKINNSLKMMLINLFGFIFLTFLDQITKIVTSPLKDNDPIIIIDGVLELRYLENHGAAFGILQGQRIFFLIMSILVFVIITYILLKIPTGKKYIILNVILSFVLAGALGNTIDRLMLGYVRDFIYFKLIDFPIFNVADIYITVSTIVLIILILFYYKESDLNFLKLLSDKNTSDEINS